MFEPFDIFHNRKYENSKAKHLVYIYIYNNMSEYTYLIAVVYVNIANYRLK